MSQTKFIWVLVLLGISNFCSQSGTKTLVASSTATGSSQPSKDDSHQAFGGYIIPEDKISKEFCESITPYFSISSPAINTTTTYYHSFIDKRIKDLGNTTLEFVKKQDFVKKYFSNFLVLWVLLELHEGE